MSAGEWAVSVEGVVCVTDDRRARGESARGGV